MTENLAFRLANLSASDRAAVLESMPPEAVAALPYTWRLWARPDQLPPEGDWLFWLLLAGRGAGKTRSAAEWVRGEVEAGRRGRLGLIAPTADVLRRDVVEGPSGILAVAPPWCRPIYEPSSRRIVWPNGAIAHLFSAEEPDRIRGSNLDGGWGDELCAWPDPQACLDMISMALRISGPKGDRPRMVISTTPRMIPTLKKLLANPQTVITRAKTMDNAANLDPGTLAYLQNRYGGTTLGRQELDGELLEDLEGALWTRGMLDKSRVAEAPPLRRIVVGIDPAGGSSKKSDETGIIAAGIAPDGHHYVIRDASGRYTPDGWARRAVALHEELNADCIVAEANFGGAMVEATIKGTGTHARVKLVTASRGKQVRAEPVVSLYEQNRVHHVGQFPELEDQLCGWDPLTSTHSPDRLDALVWAVSELMGARGPMRINPEVLERFSNIRTWCGSPQSNPHRPPGFFPR